MKKLILFLFLVAIAVVAHAAAHQPSIMVIPFVPEGADIRAELDNSNSKRQIIAQINEAFADRDYQPTDFYAEFKRVSQSAAFQDDSQMDLKSQIIQSSGADIYIEADVEFNRSSSGNSARVILKAYDASTGKIMASKIGDSGKFYVDDMGKLGAKAVAKTADDFLKTMQLAFDEMMLNGRSLHIEISFNEGSSYDMNSTVGNDKLKYLIEDWIEENAYKNHYNIQGLTAKLMVIDDVRIPVKDDSGKNYSVNKFARSLERFFESNGLEIDMNPTNGTIYVQIQ